jgi:hypothetical protein
MIQADFFNACGGFYEEYKNGFKDLDLCVQIRKRGKELRYVPESVIYYLESQTPNRKAGDADNIRLFTRRCTSDVRVDAHLHALDDNFEPFIMDILSIGIRMRSEDEHALVQVAQGKSGEIWLHLISANPLWIQGRDVIAKSLEDSGRFAEATGLRIQLVNIELSLPRYRKLLILAAHEIGKAHRG